LPSDGRDEVGYQQRCVVYENGLPLSSKDEAGNHCSYGGSDGEEKLVKTSKVYEVAYHDADDGGKKSSVGSEYDSGDGFDDEDP